MLRSELGGSRWRWWRLLIVGTALLAAPAAVAATAGPPIGRVDEMAPPAQTTQPPPARLQIAPQPPPAPPPTQPPAAPPAAAPPAEAGKPRGQMPVLQRPEQPISTTAIPGEVTPRTTPLAPPRALEYVPGYRFILSGHRENYFITGASPDAQVKFQYSAKFDLWPNASRHSVYFGFTQKSLWRLWDFAGSSPFVESNYAPEVFYGYHSKIGDVVPVAGEATGFIDFARVGLEHESNGLDGARSRGWNRAYASARVGAYFGSDVYFSVTPRAWLPPFGTGDNPDITEYLGYGSLSVEYGYDPAYKSWWGGFSISATGWKGANTDLEKRAVEIAGQWRPGYEGAFLQWWKFTPYIYVQYYDGYGETLLQYNQRVSVLRVGFAFEDRVNWITLPKR